MTDRAKQPPLYALIGPTGSGKSALAIELASRANAPAEIVSADSMQVYRGMDIGTAKPSIEERAKVPHHLIDVVEPSQSFTVAMFVEHARRIIDAAAQRGTTLIFAGGTPLYFKALFEGLFEGPPADPDIRARLVLETGEQLHARLATIDPSAAARIHANDQRRLVRALEVFELTGQPISSLQNEWAANQPRYQATWIGLQWEREAINRRINARVKSMIEAGWLDETRQLLRDRGPLSQTAAEATGYAELIAHLRGELSLVDAIEQIKIATRQLARRQMKWFRRFPNVTWLNGSHSLEALVEQIEER